MLTLQDKQNKAGFSHWFLLGLICIVYTLWLQKEGDTVRIKFRLWSMSLSFELITPPGVKKSAFVLKLAYVCTILHFC